MLAPREAHAPVALVLQCVHPILTRHRPQMQSPTICRRVFGAEGTTCSCLVDRSDVKPRRFTCAEFTLHPSEDRPSLMKKSAAPDEVSSPAKRTKCDTHDVLPSMSKGRVDASNGQQVQRLLTNGLCRQDRQRLPREVLDLITDYCLLRDFSQLALEALDTGSYTVVEVRAEDNDPEDLLADALRRGQLEAIGRLPGSPLRPWGADVREVVQNGDLAVWWVHVAFPVGWFGNETLDVDMWMCAEFHHWHGVFVFPSGSEQVRPVRPLYEFVRTCPSAAIALSTSMCIPP